jgi:hypothetical protein
MSKRFHVDPNEGAPIYEFDPEDVISDTPPNIIVIRARMTVEIAGKVGSELIKLGTDNKTESHFGAHTGALLLHNILSWSGPDFDDLPCTPANIRALPSSESDPFIAKVVEEIARRNKPPKAPEASATDSTSASAGAIDLTTQDRGVSLQSVNGESKLHSRIVSIGRQNRSDD